MRLISKYHDYYDTAVVYGIDNTVVYNRVMSEPTKTKLVDLPYGKEWHSKFKVDGFKVSGKVTMRPLIVGFCGAIHKGMEVSVSWQDSFHPYQSHSNEYYCYTYVDTVETLAKHGVVLETGRLSKFSWFRSRIDDTSGIKAFFDSQFAELLPLFQANKVPSFMVSQSGYHDEYLTLNPLLKKIQFYKVKDAPTAFQDLYMFISGVLGTSQNETVDVSDKTMAAKRGHDDPYSFRKPPGGKRGKPPWR